MKGQYFRDLVTQRIRILHNLAVEEVRRGNIDYARRLMQLAKRISEATRVRIPRRIKKGMCKHCYVPLVPGLTCTVRLRSQGKFSYIVVKCSKCGWIKRYPYKPRRDAET